MIKDEDANTQALNHGSSDPRLGSQLQEWQADDEEELNAAPQQGGINLRPFFRTLQRKSLLIAAITGLVSGGAWLSSKKTLPTYEGSFRLLVEPATNEGKIADASVLTREKGMPSRDSLSLDYPTQLEILRSPKMLGEIADRIKAQGAKNKKIDPAALKNLNSATLRQSLTVERLGKTELDQTKIIEVKYKGSDPELVNLVLKVTADKYLRDSLEERKKRINEGVKFIDEQTPKLANKVEGLRSEMEKIQQQYRLTDPQAQGTELLKQLSQIESQQIDTIRQIQEQRTLYTNLQTQIKIDNPNEAIAESALSENPRYQEVVAKLKEVEIQIAVESARFQPDSPVMQTLEDKRRNLSSLLNQETQRIIGQKLTSRGNNSQEIANPNPLRIGLIKQWVDTINQIKILEVRNQGIAKTRDYVEQQVRQLPTVAGRFNKIKEELEITNKTLEQLRTQRETLGVEAAQKQVPWEIISDPAVPKDAKGNPIADAQDTKKSLIIAVIMGLVLGVGSAVLIEKLRNIFYTDDDVKDATKLPLLGVIPRYKSPKKSRKSREFVDSSDETEGSYGEASPFLDAFDSLYASIRFLFANKPIRSLAICSSESGDGKSTVALHLAQTAAAMGQRVLLVDANLRQAQIHTMLDLPNLKGLTDLLANKLAPNDTIQRSLVTDNLFVLTSGQPLRDSSKLLASAQMKFLAESFKATFDLVIYDTPQLLSSLDANFLAAHTDGILLVVGVGKTSPSKVKQALEQLKTFNLQSLGVVANHAGKNKNSSSGTTTATILKTKRV